jgi:hypothetical protein
MKTAEMMKEEFLKSLGEFGNSTPFVSGSILNEKGEMYIDNPFDDGEGVWVKPTKKLLKKELAKLEALIDSNLIEIKEAISQREIDSINRTAADLEGEYLLIEKELKKLET